MTFILGRLIMDDVDCHWSNRKGWLKRSLESYANWTLEKFMIMWIEGSFSTLLRSEIWGENGLDGSAYVVPLKLLVLINGAPEGFFASQGI